MRQRDISDCGPACLASVCAYYGLHVTVSQLRRTAFTNQNGTSVIGLVEAAVNLNFKTKGIRAEYESLNLTTLPAIVHITDESTTHYMVLLKVTTCGVSVMDPADGRLKKISEREFRQRWTGVMILLIPNDKFKKNKKVSVFSKLKDIIVPYKNTLIMTAIWACAVSLLGLSLSLYIKEIADELLVNRNIGRLDMISVIVVILLLMQFGVTIARNGMAFKTGRAINQELIIKYYNHLFKLPQSFLDSMRVGEMLSRINDAVKITAFIQELAVNLVVNILSIIFSLAIMIYYNWRIAFMIMMMMPVYYLLYYMSSKTNQIWQRKISVSGAEFDSFLVESIGAATTIRNLSAEMYFSNTANMKLDALLKNIYCFSTRQTSVHAVAELASRMFIVVLLWIGSHGVIDNQLTAGELIFFYTLLAWITVPLLYVLDANKHLSDALIATERLVEILEIQPEKNGWRRISGSNSVGIQFKSVVFAYGMAEPILRGIDLYVPPGRIMGISGKSGSGKSTLASLLLRMYRPSSGSVFINNIDIDEFERESLTRVVSIVSQKVEMFSASITDNIVMDERYDDTWLADISERLGISKISSLFPDGMNTMVLEQGNNLSGGQKQRIAIARAMYRNTPVLILDEATVSIDEASEQKIMQTIEWYKNKGNTVIIIAHSESTLKICDNIAVLEDGVIK